jgi:hypothetical protein
MTGFPIACQRIDSLCSEHSLAHAKGIVILRVHRHFLVARIAWLHVRRLTPSAFITPLMLFQRDAQSQKLRLSHRSPLDPAMRISIVGIAWGGFATCVSINHLTQQLSLSTGTFNFPAVLSTVRYELLQFFILPGAHKVSASRWNFLWWDNQCPVSPTIDLAHGVRITGFLSSLRQDAWGLQGVICRILCTRWVCHYFVNISRLLSVGK